MTHNTRLGIHVTTGDQGELLLNAEDVIHYLRLCVDAFTTTDYAVAVDVVADEIRDLWIDESRQGVGL